MTEFVDGALVAKMAATAVLVLGATVLAERFGAFIGAIIASMPLSAGPAYAFLALENGAAFIEKSSVTSLAVHPMTVILLVITAALVRPLGIVVALGIALAFWLAGAVVVLKAGLSFETAVMLNVAVFAVILPMARPLAREVSGRPARRGLVDVVLRVLAVATVTGSAILAGRIFGPAVAGVTALVPVIWISVAVILAVRSGADMCVSVLANGIPPMIGFSVAFAMMHLAIEPMGLWVALGLALAIAVGWNLMLTVGRAILAPARATSG
jgi:hypothetical protein